MSRLLRRLAGALLLLAAPLAAAAPAVLVSVKPLQMVAAGVSAGVGEPELLIPAEASPHGYALKPSQALRLHGAKLVFWVGPGLESQLAASLRALPAGVRVESVLSWPELAALPSRGQDGAHGHGALDAHVWLDPARAAKLVRRMGAVLAEVDPGQASAYAANAAALAARFEALDAELAARLKPLAGRRFWVYHDGYQYFERRYGLTLAGALNQNPELPLKPAALLRLDGERQARCLFLDAQYRQTSLARMLSGLDLRLVELDPMGRALAADASGYEALLRGMAEGFAGCLQADGG